MSINEDLWDFPHAMQLKVMGAADAPLTELVIDILRRHLGAFDADAQLRRNPSSSGNYISLTASIVMENKEQVTAIYADLNASPHVKVVF
jgi:putative lipoic acid-binding regulatory protein